MMSKWQMCGKLLLVLFCSVFIFPLLSFQSDVFCKFLVHACGRGALTQLQCSYYQFPRSISLSAMPSGSFYLSILMSCQIPFLAMLKVKHRMRARSNSTSRVSLVMYNVILDPMYDDFRREKCLTSGEAEQ